MLLGADIIVLNKKSGTPGKPGKCNAFPFCGFSKFKTKGTNAFAHCVYFSLSVMPCFSNCSSRSLSFCTG
ncbi:unnamed protein product [Bathycoccus prasinos]